MIWVATTKVTSSGSVVCGWMRPAMTSDSVYATYGVRPPKARLGASLSSAVSISVMTRSSQDRRRHGIRAVSRLEVAVRRLVDQGVIDGYAARVNPAALGRAVQAFVQLDCYGARCVLRDPAV